VDSALELLEMLQSTRNGFIFPRIIILFNCSSINIQGIVLKHVVLFTILLLLISSGILYAQVPRYITHQGFLTKSSGAPYDTTVAMTFRIYQDSSGGTSLFEQTNSSVTVSKGIFNVALGSLSLPFDKQYYIEVQAGNQLLTPRVKLSSSAYALRADTATVAMSLSSVAARYTSSTTSFGGTPVVIVNPTKDFDTHNAYNSGTGVFTCPVSGKYLVATTIYQNAQIQSTSESRHVNVRKNGSVHSLLQVDRGNGLNSVYVGGGSCVINCIAGDTIDIVANNDNGLVACDGSATGNWVTFTRIGN